MSGFGGFLGGAAGVVRGAVVRLLLDTKQLDQGLATSQAKVKGFGTVGGNVLRTARVAAMRREEELAGIRRQFEAEGEGLGLASPSVAWTAIADEGRRPTLSVLRGRVRRVPGEYRQEPQIAIAQPFPCRVRPS
jgi:hypothetical protein